MKPHSFFPTSAFPSPYAASGPPVYWFGDYTEAGISGVTATAQDMQVYVAWQTDNTVPPGSYFQIYINKQLKWYGTATHATVPMPPGAGTSPVLHVGRVSAANQAKNYASRLIDPPGPGNRALLTWDGGRWIDTDLDHFNIYMSQDPGGVVDLSSPVASVPAAPGGMWGDGYGRGPYGRGPYGRGVVGYEWLSKPLKNGVWSFQVVSVDRMGNLSEGNLEVTVEIQGPPGPPARVGGRAVWIESYDEPTRVATLAWNLSEG